LRSSRADSEPLVVSRPLGSLSDGSLRGGRRFSGSLFGLVMRMLTLPRRPALSHTDHHPHPPRRPSSDRPVRTERRTCGGIHIQAKREDRGEGTQATGTATTPRAAVRLHAERHGTCSPRAGKPRSTRERPCFTARPKARLACAAREVTLYLAVSSPSSSRPLSSRVLASSSTVLLRVRLRSGVAMVGESGSVPRNRSTIWSHRYGWLADLVAARFSHRRRGRLLA
jgi:hypothetical protein